MNAEINNWHGATKSLNTLCIITSINLRHMIPVFLMILGIDLFALSCFRKSKGKFTENILVSLFSTLKKMFSKFFILGCTVWHNFIFLYYWKRCCVGYFSLIPETKNPKPQIKERKFVETLICNQLAPRRVAWHRGNVSWQQMTAKATKEKKSNESFSVLYIVRMLPIFRQG